MMFERFVKRSTGLLRRFARCEAGPTTTEYATMLAVVVITVMVSVSTLGDHVRGTITDIDTSISMDGGGGDDHHDD